MVDTSITGLNSMFSGYMTGNIGTVIVQVMVWLMILAAIGAVFYAVYLVITYKYKIIKVKVQGDGQDGLSVGKISFEFACKKKDRSWHLLFSRKNIEPIDDKYHYGNWVICYEIAEELVPGRISLGQGGLRIEPVSYVERKKIELELKQNALDFSKMDSWEANKIFIYTLIGAAMVIVLAGFVLWLAFEKTGSITTSLDGFGQALKGFNTIPGGGG